ncbi:MAG: amidohydrolase [Planctomycetes bacterium]|nr:amidohydrolase [Planctomycetota bacterium]
MRIALALLLLSSALAAQGDTLVLRGARVFTGQGDFQKGLVVIVKDGKIAAIGRDIPVPQGAKEVDCKDKWITPGFVDAMTALGLTSMNENEESNEVTPQVRAINAIDPEAQNFKRAVAGGVTTAYIMPGQMNVFGGLGVVYKTAGKSRVVREDAGVRMTLGQMPGSGNRSFRGFGGSPTSIYYRRPNNRMGTIWEVRRAFYDAMDVRETNLGPQLEPTAAQRVLISALDRKMKVRTTARHGQDIRTALRLAEEFGIAVILDDATEAYKTLDYVVAAGVPVVAGPPSVQAGFDGSTPHLDTLALLARAGVEVAISTAQRPDALPLVREAGFAVRGGMDRAAALAAVTSVPAKILGVDARVGSLDKGKDADIVLWSRHPLSPYSRAVRVWVDGVPVTKPSR